MPFQFTCERCGAIFTRLHKRRPPRYCSLDCRDAPRPGIPQPDGTVLVPLTKGRFAIVEVDDAPAVLLHNWSYSPTGYAVRGGPRGKGSRTQIYMHREILGLTDPEVHGDHINGDRLDNRRANLRSADRSENMANMKTHRDNRSGFRGVSLHQKTGKWAASIQFRGVQNFVGLFDTPEEASAARDKVAERLHGEFARINERDSNVIR